MCGLFFTTQPSEYNRNWLDQVAGMLRHRGPDAQVSQEMLGMGAVHTRLAVIGLGPAGAQPMTSGERDDVLVFNGELVNYASLGTGLGVDAPSDTRLLLSLLAKEDYPALDDLRGMFAFSTGTHELVPLQQCAIDLALSPYSHCITQMEAYHFLLRCARFCCIPKLTILIR